jgi:hypothetical protein
MAQVYDRFDAATRNISAYAFLLDGKPAGRVVLKHGNAVTAFFQVWGAEMATGRAGGGGYDRGTAAVLGAVAKLPTEVAHDPHASEALRRIRDAFAKGRDGSRWTSTIEDAGFVLANVTG